MTTVDLDLVLRREYVLAALIDYHKGALRDVLRTTRELTILLMGDPEVTDKMVAELKAIEEKVDAEAERILSEQIPLP